MNKIIKYKLKQMAGKFMVGFGVCLFFVGSISLSIFLAYLMQVYWGVTINENSEYNFIYTGIILWFLLLIIGVLIGTAISSIKDSWNKIEVPKIITDEKAQKQSGNLSIVEKDDTGGLSVV